MSLTAIVQLLQTALVLLHLVAAHPELPQSFRDHARDVAQNAIIEASAAIANSHTTANGPSHITPPPPPTPAPPTPLLLAPTPTQPTSARGWDYNLTKRCVKSVSPGTENYFEDTTDCKAQSSHWTIAVESEKTLGASYPGPANQSFPINASESPVTMQWIPHTDEMGRSNYSVNLKTNFNDIAHPGGAGYFTWVALMDHAGHDGGPLPRPDTLKFSATASYNDFAPQGAARFIAGFQGFWNGKEHLVEINLVSAHWGDSHPDADIVNRTTSSTLEYVTMDGTHMGLGVQRLTDSKISIDWYSIVQDLVRRGLLEAPSGGWDNSATQAVFVATEVKNDAPSNAAVADLWVTNFRIDSK